MEIGTIGNYRVIARLGRGGMSDVFLAVRGGVHGFAKLFVVKRLRADVESDRPRYRTLLLDEARIAARLRHPHIVQTFEVGEHDGAPFLAMEYLEGQPLSQVLARAHRVGIEVRTPLALRVVADTLSALEYAHRLKDYDGSALGIVHRDVSPQNIFWTYDGEIKLLDFGIAKFVHGQDETETGMLKGKLSYMAPEQARGDELDGRADVFAAGVVLWEAITGKRLLAAKTQAAQLKMLLFDLLPPLHAVKPDVDPAIASICDRALARDARDRYPSANAMRLDIERVLGDAGLRREALASFIQPLFAQDRANLEDQIRVALTGNETSEIITLDRPEATTGYLSIEVIKEATVPASPPALERKRRLHRALRYVTAIGGIAGVVAAVAFSWGHGRATANAATEPAPAAPVAPSHETTIRLCGSNTVGAELAPALAEAFLRTHGASTVTRSIATSGHIQVRGDNIVVDIAASGTATAFEGLAAKTCDLGMASRAVNDQEVAKIGDLRSPATEHVIALDGIAVIVHRNNPIRSLDRDQLRDVFAGKLTSWSQLGGADRPIHVLARDHHSGTFDTFKSLVLGRIELRVDTPRFESSEALADAVAADEGAIGFVGLAYTRSAKAIAVGDRGGAVMLPTSFTVTTEGYLLARRLYFYSPPRPTSPLVTELVTFTLSPAGQTVVRDAGFIDLEVAAHEGVACDARCPKSYATTIRGARRLSVDFRFRYGSNQIDSRAQLDLDRVVRFLVHHQSARILLLGFSDSAGDANRNAELSRQRARTIAKELETRGVHPAVVEGFGAAMPITTNTTAADRERNRRVEIWIAGDE
jgi:phosphate transport system substrate-binding protein